MTDNKITLETERIELTADKARTEIATTEYHIIGRGLATWHADGINVRSSGGDIEPRTWWADGHIIPPYQAQAIEGAPVYDAADADIDAFSKFVISGPMVNPGVTADQGSGALDYVTVTTYVRMLRERVPGVRFGTVHNGEIIWE